MKKPIRQIATLVIGTIVALGLMVNVAFAQTTATFTSSFNGTAEAQATATGVSIAGADATGKILLEELRAQIPQSVQDKWKTPTKEQIAKYGTLVHSLAEARAVVAKETKVYDQIVNKARAKVEKLKLRIKHKDGNVPKLKKKLKKAKKALRAIYVDKDWKYRPLIGLDRGVCYRNTGLRGNLDLQSFVDCVDGDQASVWIGLNPALREMRIVAVVKLNGTVEDGCLNIPDFVIPPGTPDRSLFIMVKAFASLELDVAVAGRVSGDLTVYGKMVQDGKVCDEQSKTVHVDKVIPLTTVSVSASDADKAIAFAENKVQADAQAMASATASVQGSVQLSVSQTMTLKCETTPPPVYTEIDTINDVLVNNTRTITPKGSVAPGHTAQQVCTALNGGSITVGKTQTVSGNFSAPITYKAPSEPPTANSQYGIAAGYDRVKCTLTQDDGQTASVSTNDFKIKVLPPDPQ